MKTGLADGHAEPLVEAQGLVRRAAGRTLLDGVSLAVRGGDRLAVVGPTGSGKTLLLRAVALVDPVDSGQVLWRGREVAGHAVPAFRSRVVYLHQRPALAEGTVADTLQAPLLLRVHRDKHFDRARIVSRLATLGRDASFLEKRVRDLSGGEAQLVALLRAIQLDPQVLLLDEPSAALDAEATRTVEQLVETWASEQPRERATLWVTHSRPQAERVADRIYAMQNGTLHEVPK